MQFWFFRLKRTFGHDGLFNRDSTVNDFCKMANFFEIENLSVCVLSPFPFAKGGKGRKESIKSDKIC